MSLYRVYTYDVWGNEKDGWDVNDVYQTSDYVEFPDRVTDAGIVAALKKEGLIKPRIRTKSVQIGGEAGYTLYITDARNGKPEYELRAVKEKHEPYKGVDPLALVRAHVGARDADTAEMSDTISFAGPWTGVTKYIELVWNEPESGPIKLVNVGVEIDPIEEDIWREEDPSVLKDAEDEAKELARFVMDKFAGSTYRNEDEMWRKVIDGLKRAYPEIQW